MAFLLSPQQKFVWSVLQESLPGWSRSGCWVSIEGHIEPEKIRAGVDEIVSRHEILRTVFRRETGFKAPVQVVLEFPIIAKGAGGAWEELDLSSWTEAEREAQLQELWKTEITRPVATEEPALRAVLIHLTENNFALILAVHPLCADRQSLPVLVRELEIFYSGRGAELADPLRYVQFTQWQADLLDSNDEDGQKGRSFWSKSSELSPSLRLPEESRADRSSGFDPQVIRVEMGRDQAAAVLRQPPAEFLMSAWVCLLRRLGGEIAFPVGYSASGREYEELENAVGCFARTLPISLRVESNFEFRDVLRQTTTALEHAMEFQEYFSPESVDAEGEAVSFAYQQLPEPYAGVPFRLERLHVIGERYKLRLVAVRRGEDLSLEFHYDASRLRRSGVERIAEYFENLLGAAILKPDTPVAKLPLLPESERRHLLLDWNRTAAEYPCGQCLHQLFEAQAARTPERIAVRSGEQAYRYRELNELSNQLAHYLRAQGVGPDRPVGLCLERSAEAIVALLAILKAGGAYVPLNPDDRSARLKQQLQGATAVLTNAKFRAQLAEFSGPVVVLDRDQSRWANQPSTNPALNTSPENLVYVIYTSGSTGVPKGVAVRHRNLVNYAHFITQRLELEKHPEGLQFATVSTLGADLGNTCIYPALISGGTLHVISYETSTDPPRFAAYLKKHPIEVLKIVPSHLNAWLQCDEAPELLPRKYLILGGETLTPKLLEKIESLAPGCEILNHYGPTETTVGSLTLKLKQYDWKNAKLASIPIGKPIANTEVYILDQNLEPVPIGVSGELYIAGAGVSAGYLGQAEKTAERFLKNPFSSDPNARMYRTGDLARYGEDGNIEFLGRGDDQVKVRGFRIELGEIEAALARHSAVKQALVLARGNENGDVRLLAYVVLGRDSAPSNGAGQVSGQITGEDLRTYLKQQLPDYMVPQAVVILEKLPLSANGKIDRQALPEPDQVTAKTYIAPRTAIERTIAQVWAEVLRRPADTISVDDNFFDLGGHSLLAVQLVSEIKKRAGAEIPLNSLFQGATIEHMANIVRGTTPVSQTLVHQIQVGGRRPPFFAAILAGVNPLGYVPLSKHLGPDQPFYALQAPGPSPRAQRRPYSQQEYEQVARDYVQAMRSIQPKGPYHLGGTCEGARIAFEMVRVLEAQGESAELLAVVDTWVVENTQNKRLWKLYYYGVRLKQVWQQSWRDQISWAQKAFTNQVRRWLRTKSAPPRSAWMEVYWPSQDFVPSQIHSPITVYKIPKQPFYYHPDPLLGWENRTTSTVETQIIPHGRHRLLLREPYVRELAAALSRTLEQLHQGAVASETSKPEQAEVVSAGSHRR